ncbi:hypothetical protein CYY_002122 [Polysphondylium violaceum]|uniref:Uncharacterized protein n=1 Tax=Polysphondylium violaceum TaxID=133409 RepID=A0A8J4Q8A0_9MYCE|nr:hypothetical protein CYY_002122 [Polysphondylium violaceum]
MEIIQSIQTLYGQEEEVDNLQIDFNPRDFKYKDYLKNDFHGDNYLIYLYLPRDAQITELDEEEDDDEDEQENLKYHQLHYNSNNSPNFNKQLEDYGVGRFANAIRHNHVNRLIRLLRINKNNVQLPMRLLFLPIQRGQIRILRVLFHHRCFKHMRDRINFQALLDNIILQGNPVLFKIVMSHFRPTVYRKLTFRLYWVLIFQSQLTPTTA